MNDEKMLINGMTTTLAGVGGFVFMCLHGSLLLSSYSYANGMHVFSCVLLRE